MTRITFPLIAPAAVTKVQQHLDDALAKGGAVLTGGKPHAFGGQFYAPTIVTNAKKDSNNRLDNQTY